ncbi:MAG: DUF1772 domain-containing protein [Actinomycetota bacterium]|nr:DUF1772 domain-containing protein [Actinomycetota bacterium]
MPIWRRMPPAEFVPDFEQTIRWTDKVQPALLVVAAVSAIGFAIAADDAARVLACLGAAGFVVVLLASFAILVPLQRRIVATPRTDLDAIEAMRLRWFSGNLGRSVLAVVSFGLVAVAAVV